MKNANLAVLTRYIDVLVSYRSLSVAPCLICIFFYSCLFMSKTQLSIMVTTVGRALANGFPLTEFGGFQGPFSVNSKYFNAFESRLVEARGKNNNSSSILYNFAT